MSQTRDDNRNGPDGALIDLADAAARRGRTPAREPPPRAPDTSPDQSVVPRSVGTELLSGFPDLEHAPDPLAELTVDDMLDRALAQPPSTPGRADRTVEHASGDDQDTSDADSALDDVHRRLTHHHERPGDVAHRVARGSADLAPGLAQASRRRHSRSRSATAATRSRRSGRASHTRPLALSVLVGLLVIGVIARSAFDNGATHPAARPARTSTDSAASLSATAATVVSITAQPRSHHAGAQPSSRRAHPIRRTRGSHRSQRHITTAHALNRAAATRAHNPAVAVTAPVQPTTSTPTPTPAPAPAPASSVTQTHSTQSVPSFGYQGLLGAGHGNGTG